MTRMSDYLNERRNNPEKQEDRLAAVIIGAAAVVVIVLLLLVLWGHIVKERSRKEDELVSTTYEERTAEYMSQSIGGEALSQEYLDNIAYLNETVEGLLASLTQVEQNLLDTVEQYQEGNTAFQEEISTLHIEVNAITQNLKKTQTKLQDLTDIVLAMNEETIPFIQAQIVELYENMNQIYTDMTEMYAKLAANALQYHYDEKENTLYLGPFREDLGTSAASGSPSVGNLSAYGGRVVFSNKDVIYLDNELGLLLDEIDDSIFNGASADAIFDSADKRRNLLTSHGIINYDNGKVTSNAADVLALADKTDTLANTYAAVACRALNSIGTYYNTDGDINYESQAAGAIVLSCARIVAGILQSQSVEHLEATPVTADNITAGAAAWVNGKCIIGNGADNERAYQSGIEDGAAGNGEEVDIQYTYHAHTGNSGKDPIPDGDVYYSNTNPDGCYTAAGHTHNMAGTCTTKQVSQRQECGCRLKYNEHLNGDNCYVCHHSHFGRDGVYPAYCNFPVTRTITEYTCGSPTNTWEIGCNKKAGQIVSAEVIIHTRKEMRE